MPKKSGNSTASKKRSASAGNSVVRKRSTASEKRSASAGNSVVRKRSTASRKSSASARKRSGSSRKRHTVSRNILGERTIKNNLFNTYAIRDFITHPHNNTVTNYWGAKTPNQTKNKINPNLYEIRNFPKKYKDFKK